MTDLENKVRAACADTTWGASGSDLMQIAQGTYSREDYALIMSVVWQRLGSSRWRCVYKALEVLKYLCMHGSSRCLEDAHAALHHIQTLEHYRYVDPSTHRDEGENVRSRARVVVAMISDPAVLDEEREKDKALRTKLGAGTGSFGGTQAGGISSDDYRYGSRSGGRSGGGYGGSNPALYSSYSGGVGGGGMRRGYDGASSSSRCDDEPRGGYDDEPRGAFGALSRGAAAGTSTQQSVDDLLSGGGDDVSVAAKGAAADDDDNDFNPRAVVAMTMTTTANGGGFDLESMLSGLDRNGTANTIPSPGQGQSTIVSNGGAVPMSQFVKNLAAQRRPVQQVEDAAPSAMPLGRAPSDTSMFGGEPSAKVDADALTSGTSLAPSSINSSKPSANAPSVEPAVQTAHIPLKKEVDPFADLLSTAKHTGVL
jgi:ENTH domain